uniref:Uncharacterized protein n=1 Tax=Anguilla anguilla TaxID=7936 RepID=A0A0E9VKX8_ANGAN
MGETENHSKCTSDSPLAYRTVSCKHTQ